MSNKEVDEDILNDSEKVIIKMIKHNRNARDIAEKLNVSVHTVKSHISKLERMHILDSRFIVFNICLVPLEILYDSVIF